MAKQLTNKLITNNVTLVAADKGKTIVTIDEAAYRDKVMDFLRTNRFSTLPEDPTDK